MYHTGSDTDQRKPPLPRAVGRGLQVRVGFQQLRNSQERKFGAKIEPP